MPFIVRSRVRKGIARLAAMTALGVFASCGVAAACTAPPTTQPFAAFGDAHQYFAAPGGTFEGAVTDWKLFHAGLTAGNEPFSVAGATDSQSLTISAQGLALSPSFCIDTTMPSLRFFARRLSGAGDLKVFLVVSRAGLPQSRIGRVVDVSGGSDWGAVDPVAIGALLHLKRDSVMARIAIAVPSDSSWQVDDVFVDPYRVA